MQRIEHTSSIRLKGGASWVLALAAAGTYHGGMTVDLSSYHNDVFGFSGSELSRVSSQNLRETASSLLCRDGVALQLLCLRSIETFSNSFVFITGLKHPKDRGRADISIRREAPSPRAVPTLVYGQATPRSNPGHDLKICYILLMGRCRAISSRVLHQMFSGGLRRY
ncbi:hypothetical protein DFH06DRAFT_130303 [Mycena polygramma]|nr:hypothetical protein DFH06DRAFT_130303 [Mycena polygramma]